MSVISGIVGAIVQSSAARGAARTQAQATEQAGEASVQAARISADAQLEAVQQSLDFQQGIFDVGREDLRPFREAGTEALTELAGLSAVGGEFSQQLAQPFEFGADEFQEDPGFQFRLQEGERALNRAASARGGLVSGGQLRDLTEFASGLASQEFGAARQRGLEEFQLDRAGTLDRANLLARIAGFGQTATSTGVGAGANLGATGGQTILQGGAVAGNAALEAGRAISGNLIAQGNIGAAGTVGQANAITQGLSNIGQSAQNLFLLRQLGLLGGNTPEVQPGGIGGIGR